MLLLWSKTSQKCGQKTTRDSSYCNYVCQELSDIQSGVTPSNVKKRMGIVEVHKLAIVLILFLPFDPIIGTVVLIIVGVILGKEHKTYYLFIYLSCMMIAAIAYWCNTSQFTSLACLHWNDLKTLICWKRFRSSSLLLYCWSFNLDQSTEPTDEGYWARNKFVCGLDSKSSETFVYNALHWALYNV